MEKKFNVGDRVRLKSNGSIVDVVIAKDGWIGYDENRRIAGSCPMEEVEPISPKTAFLTRLQSLLREFDAEIEYHIGSDDKSDYSEYPAITIGRERLTYDNCDGASLTSDNIMDYDKE